MAIIFLAFGKTPSLITKKIHVRHYFKPDDIKIAVYNDLDLYRHIFLDLSTIKIILLSIHGDFQKYL